MTTDRLAAPRGDTTRAERRDWSPFVFWVGIAAAILILGLGVPR